MLTPTADGVRLEVLVQPNASRTELVGPHAGALRIRIAAPPAGGAANEALVRFLADRLQVRRSAVAISSGAFARRKVLLVAGIRPETAAERLSLLKFSLPGP
jgi:uncharacterized protein (TIGR00251 family)